MYTSRAGSALTFGRLQRASLGVVLALDFGGPQVAAFLDPVDTIADATRRGAAHNVFSICDPAGPVGFFIVHPDPRDRACWWLGWFAIDQAHQGRGYGRAAMREVLAVLRHIEGCRRVRLWVARDNIGARRLYEAAGFKVVEQGVDEWRLMEQALPPMIPSAALLGPRAAHVVPPRRLRRRLRLRSAVGPFAARSIGVVRGPPLGQGPAIRCSFGRVAAVA